MIKRQHIVLWIALIALLLCSITLGTSSISPTTSALAASSPTISEFPTSGSVDGITDGPDGNLWYTDLEADKIGRITPQD
jgi:hypothetical protein